MEAVYSYGMNLTFTCNTGYQFTDDTKTDVIYCNHENQWTNLTKTCEIISCPGFIVTNGSVTFTSLEYEGVATVTCEPSYWAENSAEFMTVQCQANTTWTMVPTCKVQNLKKQSKRFTSQADVIRDSINVDTERVVRSNLDCAAICTEDYHCAEANFKPTSSETDGGVCRLFNDHADASELSTEAGWFYMQKTNNGV